MKNVVLVLYNIRSRFNVGSIFRTADAAGVQKIFLCGYTPAPPHPKIDKVALGATQTIPFEKKKRTKPVLTKLKKEGYSIIALEQSKQSMPLYQFKSKNSVVLVVGNEISGIPARLLAECNTAIEIPMYGKKESLNVSVATGIALYQIIHST